MHPILTALVAFAFGAGTSAAQTWCLIAIEKRRRLGAMWWDIVINVFGFAVIYDHSLIGFTAFTVGSALGTWWSVPKREAPACDSPAASPSSGTK